MVKRSLLALLCVLFSFSIAAANTTGVRITVLESASESGALQLTWPQPVELRIQSKLDEHLLTFSQPLGEPDFTAVMQHQAAFIRDLRFGYDTLLLIVVPGVTVEFERETNGVVVHFAAPVPSSAAPESDSPNERVWRLDYLHALALLESGDTPAAQRLLRRLARSYPQEPEILSALARAEEQLGDWSSALSLYHAAAAVTGDNRAANQARDWLWYSQGDQIRGEFGRRSTDGADDQDILRLSGQALLTTRVRALVAAEHREIQAPAVQRSNGAISDVDVSRTRGNFAVEFHSGARRAQLGLLLGPDDVGVGLQLGAGPQARHAWLEASINEPYWEYVEGLIDGADRDRFATGVRGEFGTRWQGAASIHANRYAMESVGDVADSVGLGASLGYVVHRSPGNWLAVYRLDAEYFSDVVQRTANDGRSFAPLPATSREVHAFGVEVGRNENALLRYNVGAGYSIDRKGPDAPYFALQLDYAPTPRFLLGLRANYSLAVDSREDNPVTYIGGVGEYHFAPRNVARSLRSRPSASRPLPMMGNSR